ncbi:Hsp20 family protein [bacterium]|nr:Hsp20 family protein [bacterium]
MWLIKQNNITGKTFEESLFNDFFSDQGGSYLGPQVQARISETETHKNLVLALPGIQKQDITLEFQKNNLRLAVKTAQHSENNVASTFTSSVIDETFHIDGVQLENAKPVLKNGVLTISCPKKEEANVKTLDIE